MFVIVETSKLDLMVGFFSELVNGSAFYTSHTYIIFDAVKQVP